MNLQAISLVIRDIKAATLRPPEELTTEMLLTWANDLWMAIDPEQNTAIKESYDGLRWDFERLLEQRNLIANELNAARSRIDALVSGQIHAHR